jgi:hypothetical protein
MFVECGDVEGFVVLARRELILVPHARRSGIFV